MVSSDEYQCEKKFQKLAAQFNLEKMEIKGELTGAEQELSEKNQENKEIKQELMETNKEKIQNKKEN